MAYTTEMNVNGVMTNVTHFDHSAQEIDDAVEAAKKALPRDGSSEMTGNLIIRNVNPIMIAKNTTSGRSAKVVEYSNGTGGIENFKDSSNYRGIRINTEADALSGAVKLVQMDSGAWKEYNILHTGNKPTGSYTGNGSATSRTIPVGGLGSAAEPVIITSANGIAIVTNKGAITKETDATTVAGVPVSQAEKKSTSLKLATTNAMLNANGVTYDYYVP